ncbi:MAG TPA: ABC transporter permease [bacterium]|nr:ABC transporter permease [bacterium]
MRITLFENFRSAVSFTMHNVKARFFHTFLSVLGIVIGVASLVMVLALIEGMEASVRKQILQTTSMNMVIVSSEPFKKSDGVRMRKTDLAILSPVVFDSLKSSLRISHTAQLVSTYGAEVKVDSSKWVGAQINFSSAMVLRTDSLLAGRVLSDEDIHDKKKFAVINRFLAFQSAKDSSLIPALIGKSIHIGAQT